MTKHLNCFIFRKKIIRKNCKKIHIFRENRKYILPEVVECLILCYVDNHLFIYTIIFLFTDFRDPGTRSDRLGDTVVNHNFHVRVGQRHPVRRWKTVFCRQPGRSPNERPVVHSHKKAHAHAKHHISRE